MYIGCRQSKMMRQLMASGLVLLSVVLMLTTPSAFARGPKGGGAAGALDDFDLFPILQSATGLPTALVNEKGMVL